MFLAEVLSRSGILAVNVGCMNLFASKVQGRYSFRGYYSEHSPEGVRERMAERLGIKIIIAYE